MLDIDPETISLVGVGVLRAAVEDVSTADGICEDFGPDGIADLVFKFRRYDILDVLEDLYGIPEEVEEGEEEGDPVLTTLPNRAPLDLILFARTTEGTLISGKDTLVILNRGAVKRKKNPRAQ